MYALSFSVISCPSSRDISFPKIAEQSPKSFMKEHIEKMQQIMSSSNALTEIKKASLKRKKEAYQYVQRVKTRDRKALEVITKRHRTDDPLYKSVADKSLFLSGEIDENIALLCKAIGIENLSTTNASGINEVTSYTNNDSIQKDASPQIVDNLIKKNNKLKIL